MRNVASFRAPVDLRYMELLRLTIPGDPVPKARPRFSRSGHTYTTSKTVQAEKVIRQLIGHVAEPYDKPVGIDLRFYCKTRRRTDGDNLQKLVMDALNKTVITDDYLVEEWTGRLCRGHSDPHTEVIVYTLDGENGDSGLG